MSSNPETCLTKRETCVCWCPVLISLLASRNCPLLTSDNAKKNAALSSSSPLYSTRQKHAGKDRLRSCQLSRTTTLHDARLPPRVCFESLAYTTLGSLSITKAIVRIDTHTLASRTTFSCSLGCSSVLDCMGELERARNIDL